MLHALAIGNIGGHASDGIGASLRVTQGKLEDNTGMGAIVVLSHFLEFQRDAGLEHFSIIEPKRRCLSRRKQVSIGLAGDLFASQVKHFRESSIDEQISPLGIFYKD